MENKITTSSPILKDLLPRQKVVKENQGGNMVKTALFETLIDSCTDNGDGTMTFKLEGKSYIITDQLEISKIAQAHDYIIIY